MGVVLAFLIAVGCASTAAGAHQRKPIAVLILATFDLDEYVLEALLTLGVDAIAAVGTMVDEQTGTRTAVSYPAATSPYPGAHRFVLSSGELYVSDESGRVFVTRAPTQRH